MVYDTNHMDMPQLDEIQTKHIREMLAKDPINIEICTLNLY